MDRLPDDIHRLVVQHVDSVLQLEVLLLLHAGIDRAWTRDAVSREMRIEPNAAAAQLDELCERGLLSCTAAGAERQYRFQPRDPALIPVINELATLYPERRVSIVTLIYSKPIDKLRSFADAFRLRKDPDKD